MNYYHLRYNVYENQGSAVEKERWIESTLPLNDSTTKAQLEQEHEEVVSIITLKTICLEEFELNHGGNFQTTGQEKHIL